MFFSALTDHYGYLKFDENEVGPGTRLSQFIRLVLQTDATAAVKYLQNGWCLPVPDLIISVTGGGRRCQMSTHFRNTFQRGLVAAAVATNKIDMRVHAICSLHLQDAWLITAGTNAGVMKEVGQALNNYRYKHLQHGLEIPCIGIASWQYTAGTEQLENSNAEAENNETGERSPPARRLKISTSWVRSYLNCPCTFSLHIGSLR